MDIPTPGAVMICVILAALAVIAILVFALGLQDAAGHLALDEVARHGAEGHGSEQIRHAHPHNRTVWYQQESANYTGDATDRYEAGLGVETIIIERAVEVPVEVPPEIIYRAPETSDFAAVAIDIHGGQLSCPSSEPFFDAHFTVKEGNAHPLNSFGELLWSNHPGAPMAAVHIAESQRGDGDSLSIIHGEVYPALDSYRLVGIVHHEVSRLCSHIHEGGFHGPLFVVDITGDCAGQRIDIVSRSADGYNVTAVGSQATAACVY